MSGVDVREIASGLTERQSVDFFDAGQSRLLIPELKLYCLYEVSLGGVPLTCYMDFSEDYASMDKMSPLDEPANRVEYFDGEGFLTSYFPRTSQGKVPVLEPGEYVAFGKFLVAYEEDGTVWIQHETQSSAVKLDDGKLSIQN